MENTPVYVLVELSINGKGDVVRKNVGVTFNIHEAEKHQANGVQFEFETHSVETDWQADAEVSAVTLAMRDFRRIVEEEQAEALR
jgi:hypothetical protein